MPTDEETGTNPGTEETTSGAETSTEVAATAETETTTTVAETVRGPDAYRLAFGDATEDPDLDALVQSVTPDALAALPKEAQAHMRALLRHAESESAKRETAFAERERLAQEREAAFKQKEREFRQREAATLAMAAAAKPPGDKPDIDPFTPDGAAKLAEYAAQKAAYEREAPLREQARQAANTAKWEALCDANPDLRKPKIAEEFDAFMKRENEGWTRDSGKPPPVTTDRGVRLFFAERAASQQANADAQRRSRDDAARRDAARHIGRSGGGGMPDPLARYNALRKSDPDAAFDLLNSDPTVKKAFLAAHSN